MNEKSSRHDSEVALDRSITTNQPSAKTFKVTLAYDGTDYVGWQVQPNGPTVQQKLADAIFAVTSRRLLPTASGRTDSGVHALAQPVSFRVETSMSADSMKRALNANLPADVRVVDSAIVADDFDACRDAVTKTYRYDVDDNSIGDVFRRRYAWQIHSKLDEHAMAEGAKHLLGRHDFRSFETDWPNRLDSVRTIVDSRLFRLGVDDQTPTSTRRRSNDGPTNGPIRFEVTADGFLYNMVRAMVGSLVEVGRGKHTPGWIREILEAKDRSSAGPTAPPHGLFLVSVDYER